MSNDSSTPKTNRLKTPGVKGNERFTFKPLNDAPEGTIQTPAAEPEVSTWAAVTAHIQAVSDEAGLGGVMPAIYSVIQDREEVSAAAFTQLTAENVTADYDAIAGAVDDIADMMNDSWDAAEGDETDVKAHLQAVCEEAGLGVMSEILSVLSDRESVPEEYLLYVNSDDVADIYDNFVAPAIDRVNDRLTSVDENDPGVQAFLRDEFANHESVLRDAARSRDADDDDADDRLIWGEAADSLAQMPDEILIEVTGTADPAALRDRIATIANRLGADAAIDN